MNTRVHLYSASESLEAILCLTEPSFSVHRRHVSIGLPVYLKIVRNQYDISSKTLILTQSKTE